MRVNMEHVCPLCNGMQTFAQNCPVCHQPMIDGGTINNYLGPYSPYMAIDSLPFKTEGYCVHLIYCPECDNEIRLAQALVTF
ncbi:MAG: hypothetical protein ACRDBM_13035 [Sporomusa sp.]